MQDTIPPRENTVWPAQTEAGEGCHEDVSLKAGVAAVLRQVPEKSRHSTPSGNKKGAQKERAVKWIAEDKGQTKTKDRTMDEENNREL